MKDEFFARGGESPLTDDQRRAFTGLPYFDPDPSFHFEVTLDRAASGPSEEIQTSTGDVQQLFRAGTLRFDIGGTEVSLVAYEQGHELFIPFRDATSGKETYGAGRYLDAEPREDDAYDLDFNRAYAPYCAHDDAWSCTLPPPENTLSVPVEAGERL